MTRDPDIPLPAHAYVPGQSPRHPEGAFSDICATAVTGSDPSDLAASDAWRLGLAWLDAGYFWEAHEVLEPVWMALPERSDERRLVQAVIQIANAGLKARMGRPKAVARLAEMARALIAGCATRGYAELMGLRLDALRGKLAAIETGRA